MRAARCLYRSVNLVPLASAPWVLADRVEFEVFDFRPERAAVQASAPCLPGCCSSTRRSSTANDCRRVRGTGMSATNRRISRARVLNTKTD